MANPYIRDPAVISAINDELNILQLADLHLWVDPVGGDDTNTGTLQSAPIRSIDLAADLVARIIDPGALVVVHLFAGSHVPTQPFFLPSVGGRLLVIGDGDGSGYGDLSANQTIVASGTITSADNIEGRMTMAGGLTEDQHLGLTFELLDGNAVGYRRTVAYNTADTYHFPTGLQYATPQVSNGDSYQICHSDAYIDLAGDAVPRPLVTQGNPPPSALGDGGLAGVTFINLGIRNSGGAATAIATFTGGRVEFYGVHVDRSAGYVLLDFQSCHLACGMDTDSAEALVPPALGLAPDRYAWRAWGIGQSPAGAGTSYSWLRGDLASTIDAYGVTGFASAGHLHWRGGTIWSQVAHSPMYVAEGTRAAFTGYGYSAKFLRIKSDSGDALTIAGDVYNLDRVMFVAPSGDAISIQNGGSLDNYVGPDDLSNPIAGGAGLRVARGGSARVRRFWNPALWGGTTGWFLDDISIDPEDRGDGTPYQAGDIIDAAGARLEFE